MESMVPWASCGDGGAPARSFNGGDGLRWVGCRRGWARRGGERWEEPSYVMYRGDVVTKIIPISIVVEITFLMKFTSTCSS
jgi:hypothetical protein